MQKMMMNETELATRWNISPKTLQRRRSEGRGPRFMKMSKRVVYPIDEILDYELVAEHQGPGHRRDDGPGRPVQDVAAGPRIAAGLTDASGSGYCSANS